MYALDDEVTTLRDTSDEANLRSLIESHVAETGSVRGKEILADWEHYKCRFKKIIPNDYLKIMSEIKAQETTGLGHDEALLAAFRKCSA